MQVRCGEVAAVAIGEHALGDHGISPCRSCSPSTSDHLEIIEKLIAAGAAHDVISVPTGDASIHTLFGRGSRLTSL